MYVDIYMLMCVHTGHKHIFIYTGLYICVSACVCVCVAGCMHV